MTSPLEKWLKMVGRSLALDHANKKNRGVSSSCYWHELCQNCAAQLKLFPTAIAIVRRQMEALKILSETHYQCEDEYYSCPLSGKCANELVRGCTCFVAVAEKTVTDVDRIVEGK